MREQYRNSIEEQVVTAYLSGCLVLIAEDSNAKLRPDLVKVDPDTKYSNGKLLSRVLTRPNPVLIDSLLQCICGPVTRSKGFKQRRGEYRIDVSNI